MVHEVLTSQAGSSCWSQEVVALSTGCPMEAESYESNRSAIRRR